MRFRPIGTFAKAGQRAQGKISETEYHGDVFKPEESLVAKVIRCLSLTYDDHVLDTCSVFSVGIVTGLCLTVSL
jgi:hypothetical protein